MACAVLFALLAATSSSSVVHGIAASDAAAPAPGQRLLVTSAPKLLEVFAEPGDPFGEPLSYLRDGEVVECARAADFAGQVWAAHVVDEAARGVHLGDAPAAEIYLGWSPVTLRGRRWLAPTPLPPTAGGGRPFSSLLTRPFGVRG